MERLPADSPDKVQWELHRHRYEFAARYVEDGDVVLDAACGNGYGREILGGRWVGVDRATIGQDVFVADLQSWVPPFDFDVFVGLETIEHLDDFTAYVAAAKRARKAIVLSTPIIPTTHFNPFHVHDFTREDIEALFGDWSMRDFEVQWDPVLKEDTYGLWCFVR